MITIMAQLIFTAGCVAPDGRPDNTGTGALVGGMFGALVGAAASGRHAGRNALIGGLAGALAGGLVGHMVDRDQEARLRADYPQTYQVIQYNDAVYYQQQQAAAPPQTPPPGAALPPETADAQAAPKPVPLSIEDIKALDAAGVKKDVIITEIQRSQAVYSAADVDALAKSNPKIDPDVLSAMRKAGPG